MENNYTTTQALEHLKKLMSGEIELKHFGKDFEKYVSKKTNS